MGQLVISISTLFSAFLIYGSIYLLKNKDYFAGAVAVVGAILFLTSAICAMWHITAKIFV